MVVNSSIGSTNLPDVGTLVYNGITFGCLYRSNISGQAVYDTAGRTVKWVELTLTVDGVVTLNDQFGAATIDQQWVLIRQQLNAPAGLLTYTAKGYGPLVINVPGGGGVRDLNWGPKPRTLEFIPLGGSRAASIRWAIVITITEAQALAIFAGQQAGAPLTSLVQFNCDLNISYDDEGYSSLTIRGTLEIPLTRRSVDTRTIDRTADDFRQRYMTLVAASIDLSRFRVTKRNFNISRDRRTLEWEFVAEELPWMGLPPGAQHARGSFTVRPFKMGAGLVKWMCSLRCTYSIRKDFDRRMAWAAFLSLWVYRMDQGEFAVVPNITKKNALVEKAKASPIVKTIIGQIGLQQAAVAPGILLYNRLFAQQKVKVVKNRKERNVIPIGFGMDEGLYLDSRTTSFEATWILVSSMHSILIATGLWRSAGIEGGDLWALTARGISGWKSWLVNRVDLLQDVIVDMGGGV